MFAFLNPGSNTQQVSYLRMVNPGSEDAQATLSGIDDAVWIRRGAPCKFRFRPGLR